jgi:hypothetical protein
LIGCFGQEYFFLDRFFVRLAHKLSEQKSKPTGQAEVASRDPSSLENSLARRLYWQSRRIIASLSIWLEPAFANIFPPSLATHGVFVFRKKL